MAKLIENNEMKGIQLKEGQTVLDVDGNEYLIKKGDVLQVYGDGRLPSAEELNLMYENLHLKGIGRFANDYYWSSSESNSNFAWIQNFDNGNQNDVSKYSSIRVRTVRTYKSQEEFEIGQETETGIIFDIQGSTVFECKKEDEPDLMNWYETMRQFRA